MSASPSPGGSGDGQVRVFRPTSGTAIGWLGVGLAAAAAVGALVEDHTVGSVRFALAAALFGLLVWCFMLRPRLVIGTTDLELRNPFASWHLPLAGVRRAAVRAVTRVWTDERRFQGVAVGRPVRSLMRSQPTRQQTVGLPGLGATRYTEDPAATRTPKGQLDADTTADFVVEQILLCADRARAADSGRGDPRRSWAWPELVALVALVVALVLSLVL